MNKNEPKVIYLKALFKKHKSKKAVGTLIKDFIVQANGFTSGKPIKPKVPPKDKSLVARKFILNNVEDFLGYAVEYSMFDKYFNSENFDEKI